MTYPGAGPIKDAVRRRVYIISSRYWERHGRPLGDFVVLCGPEPRDAEGLKLLGAFGSECWFVDHDPDSGLHLVPTTMPGAHVFQGELETLLQHLGPIAFINLDLMGLPTIEMENLIKLSLTKMPAGALLALTFARGREHPKMKMLGRLRAQSDCDTIEEARWALVKKMLGRHDEVTRMTYRDQAQGKHGMSMGCIVVAVR